MADNPTPAPTPAPDAKAAPTAPVGGIGGAPAKEAPKPVTIRGTTFKSEDDAYAEIERGRQSGKLLTEAQKRLHDASRKEKDFESLVGEVKTKKDAKKLIERLGLSKEEAIEVFGKYIYELEILPKELSPEQRRIKELEAEAAARKEKDETEAKTKKQQEFEAATKKAEAQLRDELTKLLTEKKFPATRIALRRLANYMASYADAGADIPVDRAADMVREDYRQEFSDIVGEATPDELAEFFGPQQWQALAKKVSEWALARARGKIPAGPQNPVHRKPVDKEEKMNPQQFLKYIGSIK